MGDPVDLDEIFAASAAALSEELSQRVGSALRLRALPGEEARHALIAEDAGAVVCGRCTLAADPLAALHLLLPVADAAMLAELQRGADKAQVEERRSAAFDASWLEQIGPLLECTAARLGRDLATRAPGLAPASGVEISAPVSPEADLGTGDVFRVRLVIELDGLPDGRLDVLLPAALALRAPLEGAAENAAAGGPDGTHPSGSATARGPLLLVDPDPGAPLRAESLAADLGLAVEVLDPTRQGSGLLGALAPAGAIVVAWDLGGRAGLELLESLAAHPGTRHVPVALSCPSPTRIRVEAAVRAGAAEVLPGSYGAEDLQRRLLRGPSMSASGAGAGRPERQQPSIRNDTES